HVLSGVINNGNDVVEEKQPLNARSEHNRPVGEPSDIGVNPGYRFAKADCNEQNGKEKGGSGYHFYNVHHRFFGGIVLRYSILLVVAELGTFFVDFITHLIYLMLLEVEG